MVALSPYTFTSLSIILLKTTNAELTKQLNSVIEKNKAYLDSTKGSSNATLRQFVGSSAALFAPIYEYGCWCYLDPSSDYRSNAHGRTMDAIDQGCKTLVGGYRCATLDAKAEELECDAQTVEYTTFNFFASDPTNLEADCEAANPGDACAQRACQIEGLFTFPFIGFFFSGIENSDDYDANMVHVNAGGPFDPEIECAGFLNPIQSESECCGKYRRSFGFT